MIDVTLVQIDNYYYYLPLDTPAPLALCYFTAVVYAEHSNFMSHAEVNYDQIILIPARIRFNASSLLGARNATPYELKPSTYARARITRCT